MRLRLTWLIITFCLAAVAGQACAAPYIPRSDDEIVERLPSRNDPAQRQLQRLHAELAANPKDVRTAVMLSQRYIDLWRDGGDPRYLGYAQAALTPWWTLPQPPVAVQVMRATLLQSTHQFPAALAALDAVLKEDPDNAQAWLTRATVLQVLGDYPHATDSCKHLARLAPPLVTITCISGARSLNGHADESYRQLDMAFESLPNAEPGIRIWVSTLLAEMAERRNDMNGARKHFEQALSFGTPDNYLLAAYADFLLEQHEPQRVVALLKDKTAIDVLLLRYALALKASRNPAQQQYIDQLKQRFEAAKMRGDIIHRREQARFELELMNDAQTALQVAQQNWTVQKEPADTLLVLQSAVAANDKQAAAPVLAWLQQTHLEDRQMTPFINQLQR